MEKAALGSKENPIKCEGPSGERAYLSRLLGPDNQFLTYERDGSNGRGPAGNILDVYILQSLDGSFKQALYFDMYWSDYEEKEAPPFFSFIPEREDHSWEEFTQMMLKSDALRDEYGDSECKGFGYMWSKTSLLSMFGPTFYASQDAFGMPLEYFGLQEITRCCNDVSEKLNGLYDHIPIQFSSRELIKQFFMTLHYVVESEELEKIEKLQSHLLRLTHEMTQAELHIWVEIIS